MMSCRLSSPVKYAEGLVEGRSIDPDFILVACSLNRVSKGRYVVVRCLNTSAAPALFRAGVIAAQFQPLEQVQVFELLIGSATSKVSARISISITAGLHST